MVESSNLSLLEVNQTCCEPSLSSSQSSGEIPSNPVMDVLVDTSWTIAYSLMLAVAIGGNAIVMWIVTGKQQNFFPCTVLVKSIARLVSRLVNYYETW